MKIKTKRIIMIVLLLTGVIWDCLCILNVVPLSYSALSAIIIGGYSFVIVFTPLLFPVLAKGEEKSNYYLELSKKEKQLSGIMIVLIAIWIITLVACIVY